MPFVRVTVGDEVVSHFKLQKRSWRALGNTLKEMNLTIFVS